MFKRYRKYKTVLTMIKLRRYKLFVSNVNKITLAFFVKVASNFFVKNAALKFIIKVKGLSINCKQMLKNKWKLKVFSWFINRLLIY